MAADLKTSLFAKLALRQGFIDEEQLRDALKFQAEAELIVGQAPKLSDILVKRGAMKPGQVQAIMRHIQQAAQRPARGSAIWLSLLAC